MALFGGITRIKGKKGEKERCHATCGKCKQVCAAPAPFSAHARHAAVKAGWTVKTVILRTMGLPSKTWTITCPLCR